MTLKMEAVVKDPRLAKNARHGAPSEAKGTKEKEHSLAETRSPAGLIHAAFRE
jgi:hypothetical protein